MPKNHREQGPANARLLEVLYPEMRALAEHCYRSVGRDHTLQPTALVHEAYLRLLNQGKLPADERHFLGIAALTMRRVLMDYARRRHRLRHGGSGLMIAVTDDIDGREPERVDLLDIDRALDRLAARNPRRAKVVEMRFFGGCTMEEIARDLQVSLDVVRNDWIFARAWLRRELHDYGSPLGDDQRPTGHP
jgi:RNA polymerase sigma factor (TIGR02999 family)